MNIDQKDFFIQTTLKICGTLDIGNALHDTLMYIRNYLPADQVFLTYYNPDLMLVNVFATATPEGGSMSDIKIPVPVEPEEIYKKAVSPEVFCANEPESHPIVKHALSIVGTDSSVMVLRLIMDGRFLGSFVIKAEGNDRFTEDHAHLIGLLNDPFAIALSNDLRHQDVLKLKDLLADDNRYLQDELRHVISDEIIGANFGLKGVMELVRLVAPINSHVLLLGETGVGKELIANAIHNLSARKNAPFIKVNCGAIPASIMDSELFGHEKGSFTGAISQKRGRFERADTGTIFLDEIGELSPDAQIRMLRVLQEKEIERVGGSESVKVDIRVIAATHRDLESMLKNETFREDLYFRLKVFPISVPPLRERKEDIPALVQYFMYEKTKELCLRGYPTLDQGAIGRLMAYDYPGNVRELEHMVERELILSRNKPLAFDDLQAPISSQADVPAVTEVKEIQKLDTVLSGYIRQVLEKTGGRVEGPEGAATLLGVKPNTLRHRMKKLGIPFGRNARAGSDR